VVGARSTLLRDAPPYAILAGYPARIVGARDPSAKPGDGAGAA
jgi:acetyltransferase-like isoleucine patch superfamily enzyme